MKGDYTIKKACKKFPAYFHDFLQANLNLKSEFLHRKITNDDVSKFIKRKAELIRENIFKRLSEEFRHHIEHFLPKKCRESTPSPTIGSQDRANIGEVSPISQEPSTISSRVEMCEKIDR